jgi:hydrogenase-4 transcriptional activator
MKRSEELLLSAWRLASSALELERAMSALLDALRERLPIDALLFLRLDEPRKCIEPAGMASRRNDLASQTDRRELTAPAWRTLGAWCRRRRATTIHSRQLADGKPAPGLTLDWPDGLVVAPLHVAERAIGVVVAHVAKGHTLTNDQLGLFELLLDPLAAALEHDLPLRELRTLRASAEADNAALLARLGRKELIEEIVGADGGLRNAMERVSQVARSDVPVLLLGETGSGKEVLARAIHDRSPRGDGPFLRVNCGAIPADLADSELFGHERGSFTGATDQRRGWFERADRGSLFLDEIGELPAAVQVRLLQILQDGTFQRVGGEKQIRVDVRVIAATHRDLAVMVSEGRFREDLWYRLAVFPIRVPPLRERPDDIPLLARHFAQRAARRFGTMPCEPTAKEMESLRAYAWPGNVRELQSVIDRAVILGDGQRLDIATSLGAGLRPRPSSGMGAGSDPAAPQETTAPAPQLASLDEATRQHIEAALQQTRGRIDGPNGAARLLRINPHTLRGRMRKLKVNWRRFRLVADAADS